MCSKCCRDISAIVHDMGEHLANKEVGVEPMVFNEPLSDYYQNERNC